MREPASFWREKEVAVVIVLRECRSGGNKLSNVRRFAIGKRLNLLQYNRTSIFGEKSKLKLFRGVYFLRTYAKTSS